MNNYNIFFVAFDKPDWAYQIKYGDNKDSYVLESNEPATEHLTHAIANIVVSLKDFYGLNEYSMTLKSVKFSQEPVTTKASIKFKAFIVEQENRAMNVICDVKIPKNIDHDNYSFKSCEVLKHVRELKLEILKYLNGERLQQELDV